MKYILNAADKGTVNDGRLIYVTDRGCTKLKIVSQKINGGSDALATLMRNHNWEMMCD